MKTKNKKFNHTPARMIQQNGHTNFRLGFIFLAVFGVFLLIGWKLVKVQIVDYAYYKDKADNNVKNRLILAARRGAVLDRKGNILAKDILHYSVALAGTRLKKKQEVFKEIESSLKIPLSTLERKIRKNPEFVYVAQKVLPSDVENLRKLRDPGVILEKRFLRVYPYTVNAAHLLGFCDTDNNPLGGIEYQYNNFLQGKPGWMIAQRDALGNQVPDLNFPGEESIDGMNIHLTLDIDYQIILDEEMKKAVQKSRAADGMAILMDPSTGEILALSNYPYFNPEEPNRYPAEILKNRSITDVFEPGSTFKIVTMAAALEHLNVNLDQDIFYCENGKYRSLGLSFGDYKKYGWLTVRRIFENSSNIGVVKIAEKLNKEVMFRYVRNFGFGMPTGVDLPGESTGILSSLEKFSRTTHLFMSFGYEIGVTPLQLITAYCAVANGGFLMKPFLMSSIDGEGDRKIRQNRPQKIRQVISEETSAIMTDVLQGVVKNGTGHEAYLESFSIAGKTGTAQLYNQKLKTHDPRKHLASFVGFFPVNEPKFALLIMIREPAGDYYGGLVAAPVFRDIGRRIMSLYSAEQNRYIAAQGDTPWGETESIPNVENLERETAEKILKTLDLDVRFQGTGNAVIRQEEVRKDGKVTGIILYLDEKSRMTELVMPALTGKSLKEALALLSEIDQNPDVDGSGIVISQQPKAGSKIFNRKNVKLVLKPS